MSGSSFADHLKTLPGVAGLQHIQLHTAHGQAVALIENKPGSQGSLAVYAYLLGKHGSINVAAAQEGLALYAEHTADAQAHPGKHPNIDRLIAVVQSGQALSGTITQAQ